MITDAVLGIALSIVNGILGLLPDSELGDLPALTTVLNWLGKVDSIFPISPIIEVGLLVLGVAVVFVTVRMLLTVWNLIWP